MEPLAQIQITVSEEGIVGLEVQADNPQQTKSAYQLLSYIAEDLHHLDELVHSKDLRRRLIEMRGFVSNEAQARAEAQLVQFLSSKVEVSNAQG
jgi:hypothetical protein